MDFIIIRDIYIMQYLYNCSKYVKKKYIAYFTLLELVKMIEN